MLETSTSSRRLRGAAQAAALVSCVLLAACVTAPPEPPPTPVAVAPAPPPAPPPPDPAVKLEEARALLARAETDVHRARARRALWLKAWEDLVAARQAVAAAQPEPAIV